MIVSFGIRTYWLSKVRNTTDSRLTDWTVPIVPLISMTSSILNARSVRTKRPEMIFDTDVWAAKPIAIPAIPAAPRIALMLIPSRWKTVKMIRTYELYQNFKKKSDDCYSKKETKKTHEFFSVEFIFYRVKKKCTYLQQFSSTHIFTIIGSEPRFFYGENCNYFE